MNNDYLSGYGAAIYWRSVMKDLANQNGEICPCWSSKEPRIDFEGDEGFEVKVSCLDKTCDKTFPQTEKGLIGRFMEFYKV